MPTAQTPPRRIWGFAIGDDIEVRGSIRSDRWQMAKVVAFDADRNVVIALIDDKGVRAVTRRTIKNPKLIRPFKLPNSPDDIERFLNP